MKSLSERFETKYTPEPNSGCWLWMASYRSNGYGQIGTSDGRVLQAHRVAYELYVGPIPPGLDLDHKCRVRCCVNPAHLEPVTRGENIRRGVSGKMAAERQLIKTHCPHGHPYSGDNLRFNKDGTRYCRSCKTAGWQRWHISRGERVP